MLGVATSWTLIQAHVLHDAEHWDVDLAEHLSALASVKQCYVLWCRHYDCSYSVNNNNNVSIKVSICLSVTLWYVSKWSVSHPMGGLRWSLYTPLLAMRTDCPANTGSNTSLGGETHLPHTHVLSTPLCYRWHWQTSDRRKRNCREGHDTWNLIQCMKLYQSWMISATSEIFTVSHQTILLIFLDAEG